MQYHTCAIYHQVYCVDVPALMSSDQWFVVVGSACVSFGFFLFDQTYEDAANYIGMD